MSDGPLPCQWCGEKHGGRCPQVKAIEFDAEGRVKRVEFMTAADYLAPLAPLMPYTAPVTLPMPSWPLSTTWTCGQGGDAFGTPVLCGPNTAGADHGTINVGWALSYGPDN